MSSTWSDRDEVICPYCGHVHKNNFDRFEGCNAEFDDEVVECSECGKEFYVSREIQFYYQTYKKEEEG